jgi:hypothetical protein
MIFPEGDDKAENKSVTSTSSAESILRRQKLKTAAGRLSVRRRILSRRGRHSCVPSPSQAVIVTLRRMYRGTSVKQAEQKLQFELMN